MISRQVARYRALEKCTLRAGKDGSTTKLGAFKKHDVLEVTPQHPPYPTYPTRSTLTRVKDTESNLLIFGCRCCCAVWVG